MTNATLKAKIEGMRAERRARFEGEIAKPSFPPRESYGAYPKRCPACCAVVQHASRDGICIVQCECGHGWLEVAEVAS